MTINTEPQQPRVIDSTDHLKKVLGIPYSPEQLEAITAPLGQAQAIIAGAGSGKTAVMAARVVWLVGHVGVAPESILGLTFTTKAASELGRRVRSSLSAAGVITDEGEPEVSTYHAFASALIREHGLRIGVEPDLQVLSAAKRFQLAANVVHSHVGRLEFVSASTASTVKALLALDGQLSEHLKTTDELREHDRVLIADLENLPKRIKFQTEVLEAAQRRTELSWLVDEYREAKRTANAMDFSDQMAWGAQLAQSEDVIESLQNRFSVILLDEYQDTSIAQRDLLQSLFRGQSISAVGDPAQGIYGWRGAASGNLTGFLGDFADAQSNPGQAFSLSVTRRCAPEIIDLAAVVAKDFYSLPAVSAVVTPLEAAPENPAGEVSVSLHHTVTQEIEALAGTIQSEHDRGVAWEKIAVLVRNSAENRELVRALRAHQIPVELVGLTGLLSQPEVLDVLSVLEVLEDVTNNPALLRVLTGPRWRIGDRDLVLLGKRARYLAREPRTSDEPTGSHEETLARLLDEATERSEPTLLHSILEALESPGDAPYGDGALERFSDITAMFSRLRSHAHEPLPDVARMAIRELDLDVELEVAGIGTDNLALLIDAIADFADDEPYATLTGLLAYLSAEEQHNQGMEVASPTQSDSVKVLTIHKAKGLEYASVFMPFASHKVFPNGKSRDSWLISASTLPHPLRGDVAQLPVWDFDDRSAKEFKADMAEDALMEEVRLAYVGFTRAETRLHVSGHRWGRTQKKPRKLSAFLETVADWLRERGVEPVVWAPEPEEDEVNPHQLDTERAWPAPVSEMAQRRDFAAMVTDRLATEPDYDVVLGPGGEPGTEIGLEPEAEAALSEQMAAIGADVEALLAEAETSESDLIEVDRPAALSVTAMMSIAKDEAAFASLLARPMPRRPAAAARFGTRFHAWVEGRYDQQSLFDLFNLDARGDEDVEDDSDLASLKSTFEKSEYANREPVATEVSFTLQLGAQTMIGTIDAVFGATGEYDYEIVDWKTNKKENADPLQLALYRLAWAESRGVPIEKVKASFYYVRLDKTVSFAQLPGRDEIEQSFGLA